MDLLLLVLEDFVALFRIRMGMKQTTTRHRDHFISQRKLPGIRRISKALASDDSNTSFSQPPRQEPIEFAECYSKSRSTLHRGSPFVI